MVQKKVQKLQPKVIVFAGMVKSSECIRTCGEPLIEFGQSKGQKNVGEIRGVDDIDMAQQRIAPLKTPKGHITFRRVIMLPKNQTEI